MTAEEERRIAERVYAGKEISIIGRHPFIKGRTGSVGKFSPSLSGAVGQRLQALDCIVAATNMGNMEFECFYGNWIVRHVSRAGETGESVVEIYNGNDILAAALNALSQ